MLEAAKICSCSAITQICKGISNIFKKWCLEISQTSEESRYCTKSTPDHCEPFVKTKEQNSFLKLTIHSSKKIATTQRLRSLCAMFCQFRQIIEAILILLLKVFYVCMYKKVSIQQLISLLVIYMSIAGQNAKAKFLLICFELCFFEL